MMMMMMMTTMSSDMGLVQLLIQKSQKYPGFPFAAPVLLLFLLDFSSKTGAAASEF